MKIALGMSGGVDSSLCAHLLKDQGHDVTGVYLECWRAPGCRTEEDRQDALKVALSLDIPFQVLDFKDAYREKVVEAFLGEYRAGRTPNPDVLCNLEIKFGLFYDWAMENGFDAVATGHYAKIVRDENNRPQLTIPKDKHKDQTYFLYLMREEQLEHAVFPLADLMKDEVRTEAKKRGIHVAEKKDSVGICFIGDIDVRGFLKDELGENPGEVVDSDGNVIGRHRGLWFYTVGQRHGFEIDKKSVVLNRDGKRVERENLPPFYVVRKDAEKNQLVVGFGAEAQNNTFKVYNLHEISKGTISNMSEKKLLVRVRHTGKLVECRLEKEQGGALIQTKKPIHGISAGQSAVFYHPREKNCLGGSVIV